MSKLPVSFEEDDDDEDDEDDDDEKSSLLDELQASQPTSTQGTSHRVFSIEHADKELRLPAPSRPSKRPIFFEDDDDHKSPQPIKQSRTSSIDISSHHKTHRPLRVASTQHDTGSFATPSLRKPSARLDASPIRPLSTSFDLAGKTLGKAASSHQSYASVATRRRTGPARAARRSRQTS